jgi:hypothetical protein
MSRRLPVQGRLTSPNGQFWLTLQTDGSLVLYSRQAKASVWSSSSRGPAHHVEFHKQKMRICGDDSCNHVIWEENVHASSDGVFSLDNQGTLVVRQNQEVKWSSAPANVGAFLQSKRFITRKTVSTPCFGRLRTNYCYNHGDPVVSGSKCACACDKGFYGDFCNKRLFRRRGAVEHPGTELEAHTGKTAEQCMALCVDNSACRSFEYDPVEKGCSLRNRCVSTEQPGQTNTDKETYFLQCAFLGDAVSYDCDEGYSTDGSPSGLRSFTAECGPTGFTGGGACQFIVVEISGDIRKKYANSWLDDASVCIGSYCGKTDGGEYEVDVPPGDYTMTVSKSGYQTQTFPIHAGETQSMDVIDLPKNYPSDTLFVTFEWAADHDMDSKVKWGEDLDDSKSCYSSEYSNGNDDVGIEPWNDSYGGAPELWALYNLNKCTQQDRNKHCRLVFYSKDSSKTASKVTVRNLGGDTVAAFNKPAGTDKYHDFFTIDLATGKLYPGNAHIPNSDAPAPAFIGPEPTLIVEPAGYRLAVADGITLTDDESTVTHFVAEAGSDDPGSYSLRSGLSGSKCLNDQAVWEDCPITTYGLQATDAPHCIQRVVVKTDKAACKTLLGFATDEEVDNVAMSMAGGAIACPLYLCSASAYLFAKGDAVCQNGVNVAIGMDHPERMNAEGSGNDATIKLCPRVNTEATLVSLTKNGDCPAARSVNAYPHINKDDYTELGYVFCFGPVEAVAANVRWQALSISGSTKVQLRSMAGSGCLQAYTGTASNARVNYCNFNQEDPVHGETWDRSLTPINQQWKVLPPTA